MPESTPDHDILIELRTELRGVRDEINKYNDTTSSAIKDHEARIRSLETSKNEGVGSERIIQAIIGLAAAGLVEIIVRYLFK